MTSRLFAAAFATDAMTALFDDAARIGAMLRFEAALAEAEAEAGVIPREAAEAIVEGCASFEPDLDALVAAARAQAAPAIPLVKALAAHCREPGRRWVHWGATSQDVIDTGLVLQMRQAADLLDADLAALGDALARHALEHRDTVMAGRTLLQPALPITFGFKCATWLDAVTDARLELAEAASAALVLQFGGAVGTLAALGARAATVRAALGRRLGLPVREIAWHVSRGRMVRLGAALAALCGTLGKIAGDVALLMQPELGEAAEPDAPGRGGSSTMPHKRNPLAAPAARAATIRAGGLMATMTTAMMQEHERGIGGWQAEWVAMPELFGLAAGALRQVRDAAEGLTIDARAMRANLDIASGAMMAEALMVALAPHIGRGAAHDLAGELVRRSAAEGRSLAEIAKHDQQVIAHLDSKAIEQALDPLNYRGLAGDAVDAAVRRWQMEFAATGGRDAHD